MKIVEQAVDRLVENLSKVDSLQEGHYGSEDYGYFGTGQRTATVVRLRFDWELADDSEIEDILPVMAACITPDLIDIVENGDCDNIGDALLHIIDGAKKRNKQPILVDIFRAKLYQDYKEKKKSTGYNLYLLMAIKWSE